MYEKTCFTFFWHNRAFNRCEWMNVKATNTLFVFLSSHTPSQILPGRRVNVLYNFLHLSSKFIFVEYLWVCNHHLCLFSSAEVLYNHESHCLKRAGFVLCLSNTNWMFLFHALFSFLCIKNKICFQHFIFVTQNEQLFLSRMQ